LSDDEKQLWAARGAVTLKPSKQRAKKNDKQRDTESVEEG
jgi:hypothetical protein